MCFTAHVAETQNDSGSPPWVALFANGSSTSAVQSASQTDGFSRLAVADWVAGDPRFLWQFVSNTSRTDGPAYHIRTALDGGAGSDPPLVAHREQSDALVVVRSESDTSRARKPPTWVWCAAGRFGLQTTSMPTPAVSTAESTATSVHTTAAAPSTSTSDTGAAPSTQPEVSDAPPMAAPASTLTMGEYFVLLAPRISVPGMQSAV